LQAGTGRDIRSNQKTLDGERFDVWFPDFACNGNGVTGDLDPR